MKMFFYLTLMVFCCFSNAYALDNISFTASSDNTLKSVELEAYKQLKLSEAILIIKNKEKEPFAYGMLKVAVSFILLGNLEEDDFLKSTKLVHCLDNMETDTLLQYVINEGKANDLKNVPLLKYVSTVALNKCEYFSQDEYSSIMEVLKSYEE